MSKGRIEGELRFSDEGRLYATRKGQSQSIVTRCLAVERDVSGRVTSAVLDRLIHQPDETEWDGYGLSGCFVTALAILARPALPT